MSALSFIHITPTNLPPPENLHPWLTLFKYIQLLFICSLSMLTSSTLFTLDVVIHSLDVLEFMCFVSLFFLNYIENQVTCLT